ncbi:GTP-binding protein [Cyanobium gracile]|uniref:GTP-binding protein n=1 Tax=Cyanobium gracile UHCC 0281 TaxID=3110309 RepID=A0ABU5SR98_9CYAN|nr:GTP-binding protein [Cyanobium gracile]MEA5440981.1 GTP-binding protein [Cyanobium gracile UHCC 0281]
MKLPQRLWIWILLGLLALVVLGMVLQAVQQLQWTLSTWLPYWMVGPLMLVVLVALLLALAQVGWPWLQRLRRPGPSAAAKRVTAAVPSSRREAAQQNLGAIDRTLEKVRHAVEREALRQERQRMEAELERGDLVIVVFGTGSAGKTSLIRALLQELVGEVGAPMGSTTAASRYRLRLRDLPRAVILEDTPGILEAGRAGRERERLARGLAARADLLLLVLDGDLRASELEVFEALAGLGKRLLLVLNKCDLRGEEEERRLLALLRQRCAGRLAPEDVIPASAAPQSVPMPGGRPLQPAPEVEALLRRVASVLHADGEELIADNLLLQCRRLNQASQDLLDRQRNSDASSIVDRYMWIGAGVVMVTPLPGVDLLATAAVNAQMVVEIGRVYGVSLSRDTAQDLALSVGRTLAGLGLIKGGVGLITSALSLNLPALVVSRAIQAVSAAWLTRVAGRSFITYFRQNQDWGDGGLQEVLQREYDLNKREGMLRSFLETALNRVVEPLQQRQRRRLPPRPGPRGGAAEGDRGNPAP